MLSKISFGNIVKVNAPVKVAEKITTQANQMSKVLYGNQQEAYAYSFPDSPNESYIFTGEEAHDYWESYSGAWDEMDAAYAYYGTDELAGIATGIAWETHEKNIRDMIQWYPHNIPEIKAELNDKEEIKSVDIVA